MTREEIRNIWQQVKPHFQEKLGHYTHKRFSDDWFYYSLGFVKEGMLYVFGFNIGFFREEEDNESMGYDQLGMNVLVRENGDSAELRKQWVEFFRKHLKVWINQPEGRYHSDRGGEGPMFKRYKHISEFKSQQEIVDYLKECIDGIHALYPYVFDNPDNIFEDVLRAAPMWEDTILYLAKTLK